ncbi:MAG: branched-chain amino acid transaminase [Planctomycetota bacterium]|jgi:branched-chain amino acid aminotransferase
MQKVKYIWMNGKLVDWDDANVHVLCHGLHYGSGIFEGIRAYETQGGRSAVFRLKAHTERLFDSAKIFQMDIGYDFDTIFGVCKEILAVNGLKAGYIRPIVFYGGGGLGVHPGSNPINVSVAAWEWGAYLGETALQQGIRARISSFQRFNPNSVMSRAKVCGMYASGVLAKVEAKNDGFDEGILLDPDGFVAEGTGENMFVIKDGIIRTTPPTTILPGITRKSIIKIARDLGYEVLEQRFTRDDLYIADEAFFTGTAAEVTPIREIDRRTVGQGKPGPITKKIQTLFFDIVKGRESGYSDWLDYYDVKKTSKAKAAK